MNLGRGHTARAHGRARSAAAAAAALAIAALAVAGAQLEPAAAAPTPAKAAPSPKKEKTGQPKLSKAKRRELARRNRRQKRPNVIVVMTDDQEDSMVGLPWTERTLGSGGTTFRNSYVSFPLCCPTRATLLTGQYAHNHGVVSTELPNGYNALDHRNTLAVWLKRAGYRTAMVGKYLNGYGIDDGIAEPKPDRKERPPGWSEWVALTAGKDQRRYSYKLNENGRIVTYRRRKRDYVTDVLADKAVDFVDERAPRPKPFFLWFNPSAPHGEAGGPTGYARNPTPAPRHIGDFEGALRPRTPNFNPADVSDKPGFIRTIPRLGTAEILDIDLRYQGRAESLLSVDDAIKRIWNRLRKAGDKRKTYVIFTSDNGLMMGAQRLLLKNYIYEEDVAVPLVIRGPDVPRGVVRDDLVTSVVLAPTIVDITRVEPRLLMDGRSLLPIANGDGPGLGRDLLFERTGGDAAIRRGNWIFVHRLFDRDELYNLAADPWQLDNRLFPADEITPVDQAMRNQLAARLVQLRACAGASCP
ncbi:MAG: sulfatase family protein [Solirubrobacterales bacterium]